jgi:MFS family permease
LWNWFRNHPLADKKFAFFIFCLIPVQTLFAHNWLTLPMYVERAYRGTWLGDNFEKAVNFNPILIFILVPIVTALTQKKKVYNMMIIGTAVMAAPTFLLALGPGFWTLLGYLVIMTLGEAMWQPRFLQYAAEIAPEGRTGIYMGVAQFPWFLTKMITSLYSGWFLKTFCPAQGPQNTQTMWLIYGFIAISSSIMLILARNWLGKDFKTKA